MLGNNH